MQTERQVFLSEAAKKWGLEYHQVETFWNESATGKEFYKKIKECVRLKRLAILAKEDKPTHNIPNGEELFLQAQHEARIENEDYLAAMEQSNFE